MFHLWLDIEEFQPGELVLFRLSSSAYFWPAANALIKNIPRVANAVLSITIIFVEFSRASALRVWVMAPQIVESCQYGWENMKNAEIMENMEKIENINQMA